MLTNLLQAIGNSYKYTADWEGTNYCGLTFKWNYSAGYVDVSMPGYVQKTLKRLQHTPRTYPQYSPHAHVPIQYATKIHDNIQLHPILPFYSHR